MPVDKRNTDARATTLQSFRQTCSGCAGAGCLDDSVTRLPTAAGGLVVSAAARDTGGRGGSGTVRVCRRCRMAVQRLRERVTPFRSDAPTLA